MDYWGNFPSALNPAGSTDRRTATHRFNQPLWERIADVVFRSQPAIDRCHHICAGRVNRISTGKVRRKLDIVRQPKDTVTDTEDRVRVYLIWLPKGVGIPSCFWEK